MDISSKSEENWKVGCDCLQNGQLNAAANRLYYGVFQAVLMYAVNKQNLPAGQAMGTHAKIARVVSKIGQQSGFFGAQFARLMMLREKADYREQCPTQAEIEALIGDSDKTRQYFLSMAK